jgi:hypothetical protein
MICIGVDYSLNSPALCIHEGDNFSFSNCTFRFLAQKKSQIFKTPQFYGIERDNSLFFQSPIEKYNYTKNILFSGVFDPQKNYNILIEDFSFGSVGRSILNIAENSAIMKYSLKYEFNVNYATISPKTIKKFATGSGNASKDDMINSFVSETGFDIMEFFDLKEIKNPKPVDDLVDSYFLCKYTFENP